ncbi:MAG: MFS transporter [Rhizobiales bacterium]|nr:MFS transporter [Hyphomicrobiales bacterium]|tara:strand:- start:2594 stop:3793 length:1200 start_codon:yes stop_codon:yes gene_type:complete
MDPVGEHASASNGNADWLVGHPKGTAQAAALWAGSAGLLILGLQPILLGALFSDNRVDFDELALAATAEILAIGIGSVLAAFVINTRHLRSKAALLLALVAAGDLLTAWAPSPDMIIVLRGLTGFAEGGLVAFAVELIARSRHPGRYGGYFVTMQTIAQSLMAALLAFFVIGSSGSKGGFIALGIACLLSIAATVFMPVSYGELPEPDDKGQSGIWRPLPLIALGCIFFFYMFLGAVWAFLEPLAGEAGISARTAALMVSVSLAAQVAGAGSATLVESRLPFIPVLLAAGAIAAVIAAALAGHPDTAMFWALAMSTGFIWLFVVPFQIRMTITADDSRKTALLVPAAQLCGAALGPAFASAFISGASVTPVAWFACGSAGMSVLLALVFMTSHKMAGGR